MVLLSLLLGVPGCDGGTTPCPRGECTESMAPGEGNPLMEVEGPDTPDRSLDDTLALFTSRIDRVLPTPLHVREVYRDLMVHRQLDPPCPPFKDPPDPEDPESSSWTGVWDADCETDEGAHFFGTAIYSEEVSEDPEDAGHELAMLSSYEITDLSGVKFTGGGSMAMDRHQLDGSLTVSSELGGTYSYPGADGWLDEGADTSLFVDGTLDEVAARFTINGGVGWPGLDLDFRQTEFSTASCGGLPSGTVRLRDPSGYWLALEFADCDPCAQAMFNDHDQGQACVGDEVAATAWAMWDELAYTTVDE